MVLNHTIITLNNIFIRNSTTQNSKGDVWFFHGFGESGLSFIEAFSSPLRNNFNIYIPDFPGFGASPLQTSTVSLENSEELILRVLATISKNNKIFIVAHSLGSIIGTWICQELKSQAVGFFNIEGNLTREDAYFSGMARDYEDADKFHKNLLSHIYEKARNTPALQRYFASICFAQPVALLGWGKSAATHSETRKSGREFASLDCAKLYYWGIESTPEATQNFIKTKSIPNKCFGKGSHWPMVEHPEQCYGDILAFFINCSGE